ncbi:hypothetical protein AVEN_86110-1 [Araneus ventricosus]|uniref:Uncharacterized protein n=1 Tax=Araneus ventricosus TaxID=182803 RepID=A0A4Y2KH13_ARAVE|nr:hypothetical protein AVEN_86110-1 [Araneus ventricosus]
MSDVKKLGGVGNEWSEKRGGMDNKWCVKCVMENEWCVTNLVWGANVKSLEAWEMSDFKGLNVKIMDRLVLRRKFPLSHNWAVITRILGLDDRHTLRNAVSRHFQRKMNNKSAHAQKKNPNMPFIQPPNFN